MTITLLGTTTSPFTRKLRIALELAKVDWRFRDTREPAGAALLAASSALGKVPVLLVEGAGPGGDELVLPDSDLALGWLWEAHGAALAAAGAKLGGDWGDKARQVLVAGMADAAVNRFYLLRDGLPDQGYVTRQGARVEAALEAIAVDVPGLPPQSPFGLAALELGCALDWMVFRQVVELSRWPALAAFREAWHASGIGRGTEPG